MGATHLCGAALVRRLRPEGRHVGFVLTGSFTPDGARLATGGQDGTIKIWDVDRAALVLTLDQHGSWVYALRFSGDGRRLVSGLASGAVQVFDAMPVSGRAPLRRAVRARQQSVRAIVEPLIARYVVPDVVEEAIDVAALAPESRETAVRLARSVRPASPSSHYPWAACR